MLVRLSGQAHRHDGQQDEPSLPVGQEQVDELLGRFVIDLGATTSAGNVNLGDRLGERSATVLRSAGAAVALTDRLHRLAGLSRSR